MFRLLAYSYPQIDESIIYYWAISQGATIVEQGSVADDKSVDCNPLLHCYVPTVLVCFVCPLHVVSVLD